MTKTWTCRVCERSTECRDKVYGSEQGPTCLCQDCYTAVNTELIGHGRDVADQVRAIFVRGG